MTIISFNPFLLRSDFVVCDNAFVLDIPLRVPLLLSSVTIILTLLYQNSSRWYIVNDLVRAFLSIDIDDQSLLSQIEQIQQRLDTQAAKMKLVEINNIHFTLHFFGDTRQDKISQIQDHLAKIEIEPFEIRVAGVGAFPNKRRPRVIWIGVSERGEKVRNLKLEIDSLLKDIGYQTEKRKYTPHATIARVRHVKDSERIASNLEDLVDESIGSMTVSGFTMKKSTLTPTGPIYDTMWRLP